MILKNINAAFPQTESFSDYNKKSKNVFSSKNYLVAS